MFSTLKWCSLRNCNWCVSLDIAYFLALTSIWPYLSMELFCYDLLVFSMSYQVLNFEFIHDRIGNFNIKV